MSEEVQNPFVYSMLGWMRKNVQILLKQPGIPDMILCDKLKDVKASPKAWSKGKFGSLDKDMESLRSEAIIQY